MRVTMTAENEVNVDEKPRHPDRTRDLFGVQLEVNFKKIYVKNLIFLIRVSNTFNTFQSCWINIFRPH